ncbi:hypothetical protein, partial [Saccharothrix longispora]|uniref:hypothetical protein n=1 Tax=Saccharothrix longispora TaxID=33920 RepID=UPI0028FD077E
FYGLRVAGAAGNVQIYDPLDIEKELKRRGLHVPEKEVPVHDVSAEARDLVEKFAQYFTRKNLLRDAYDSSRYFTSHRLWKPVIQAALNADLVHPERRGAKGTGNLFYRKDFSPEELMAGFSLDSTVSAKIRRFWDEIAGKI